MLVLIIKGSGVGGNHGQTEVRDAQDQSKTLQVPTIELNNMFSALAAAKSL